jgi:hypothetical protein
MTNDLDASIFDEFSGLGAGNTTNTGGLTLPALQGSGAGSFAPGNPLGFGASSATDASSTSTGSPADLTGISSAGAVGMQGSVGTVAGAGSAPVGITDLPGADTPITGAGKSVQSGVGTVGGDITSGVGGLTGTAASAISSLETYTYSAFVGIALVVMGIIFIAFGLGVFGKHR